MNSLLAAFARSDPLRPRIGLAFATVQILIIGLLAFVGVVLIHHFRIDARLRTELNRSFERRWELQGVLSVMQDAETGQRGYIITG